MTKQEIFDTVVNHLRAQGKPAASGDKCLYRAPNGTKCAFGALIPDELYCPTMENQSAGNITDSYPLVAAHLGISSRMDAAARLIQSLQFVHDSAVQTDDYGCVEYDTSRWEGSFEGIALEHELTYTKENA